MKVKVTERSALVRVAASSQQITAHAGLVLVRELVALLGVAELLDCVTVKKRKRGYSPAQAMLALCETLIAGGECLDDVAVLRADSAQELLRGHGLPEPTTLGRFLRRFTPRASQPAQPGTRRAVRSRPSACRAMDGDARS